jgi:DNA-binding protein H-NS
MDPIHSNFFEYPKFKSLKSTDNLLMAKRSSLLQIQSEISKLTKQRDALLEKRRAPALAKIVKEMQDCGITLEDVQAAMAKSAKRPRPASSAGKSAARGGRRPRAPKTFEYRDSDTGMRWSGWGPRPSWLRAHIEAGRSLEEFQVPL